MELNANFFKQCLPLTEIPNRCSDATKRVDNSTLNYLTKAFRIIQGLESQKK